MTAWSEIEFLAMKHAEARGRLGDGLVVLERDIARAKAKRMPVIKVVVADVVRTRDQLKAAIARGPENFKKPKTQIVHGLRIGFRKGKGKSSSPMPRQRSN